MSDEEGADQAGGQADHRGRAHTVPQIQANDALCVDSDRM